MVIETGQTLDKTQNWKCLIIIIDHNNTNVSVQ